MAQRTLALLGANGLLGSRFQHYLAGNANFRIVPLRHAEADITQTDALFSALKNIKPDWVINCTAFLNTDRCEKEPENSYRVNFLAVRNLAQRLPDLGARLIHFSTDYVFDGKTGGYTEDSTAHPLSYYGLHKYLADEAILASGAEAYILRVASVMGAGPGKPDLVKALLGRVSKGARELEVVEELQISVSTPQFIVNTAARLMETQPAFGLYNTVAQGQTSWLAAAREAFSELGLNIPFKPVAADAFPRLAARPMKSWLQTGKLESVA
ncbi:MAG TPA: sugar nucleotide-binding protein, partial [Alphaproteobacteria bacterium]|nr:sugar nucleotide-binding protein [Alphaproteobacteria bacterium]